MPRIRRNRHAVSPILQITRKDVSVPRSRAINATCPSSPLAAAFARAVRTPRDAAGGTRILHGAVLTAEHGAQLRVGQHCVIMENAVLRAAGRFPLTLGDRVLVGPHAYVSGATIGSRCFIATGAMVFNGAEIGEGSVLALDAKAHIATRLPRGSFVPIGFIAVGESGRILSPAEAPTAHEIVDAIGFTKYVFGWEPGSGNLAERYARALGEYLEDRPIVEG